MGGFRGDLYKALVRVTPVDRPPQGIYPQHTRGMGGRHPATSYNPTTWYQMARFYDKPSEIKTICPLNGSKLL